MDVLATAVLIGIPALIAVLILQGALALFSPRLPRGRLRTFALTYSPGEGVWLILSALTLGGILLFAL
jgi:hypothetical protein